MGEERLKKNPPFLRGIKEGCRCFEERYHHSNIVRNYSSDLCMIYKLVCHKILNQLDSSIKNTKSGSSKAINIGWYAQPLMLLVLMLLVLVLLVIILLVLLLLVLVLLVLLL